MFSSIQYLMQNETKCFKCMALPLPFSSDNLISSETHFRTEKKTHKKLNCYRLVLQTETIISFLHLQVWYIFQNYL